jgi:predicted secreted hydrolase
MIYQLRLKNGGIEPFSSGTLVDERGRSRHLKRTDFALVPLRRWKSSSTKGVYPARWTLSVPSAGLRLEVVPVLADQELRPRRSGTNLAYWKVWLERENRAREKC